MWNLLVLVINSAFIFIEASKTCQQKSDINVCDYVISPEPIVKFVLNQRMGETLNTCLMHFERFDWSFGVFCPDIAFCGFGLDLDRDYTSSWDREMFSPAGQICYVIADSDENTCEQVKQQLQMNKLFSS